MLRPTRLLFLLVATTLTLCISTSTKTVAQTSSANSKLGSIKGRVLSDGQAVTNASVTVSSVNSPRQSRAVPVNDDGDFEVKGLEFGMYRVQVSAPAYVTMPAGPDEEIHRVGDSITLNMIKGGVITGRVLTADNDAVVAVRVRALMVRDQNGRLPMYTSPPVDRFTDDRGVYRIFGLVPGTYVVSAGGRGFSGSSANAYDNDVPTFAPSSTRDTAEQVTISAGDERTVDIRYRGNTGRTVSGNVNAPATPDSPWITINLDRVITSALDSRATTFQKAGTTGFDFKGVADGEYLIWAEYGSRADGTLLSEPRRITVKGADVTGLELIVKPLASVAGVLLLEPSTIAACKDKRRPLFEETLISLQRNQPKKDPASDQLNLPSYSSAQVSAENAGNFLMRNLAAGQYNINIRTFAKYWYLRSLTLPGLNAAKTSDLARELLTLRSGDRITGLKATLTEGAASLSGQVELPEDQQSARIALYLLPAEKDKTDDVLRYFVVPVNDGSFTIDHLPPGLYFTIAKLVTAENETHIAALRAPAAAPARLKLRREAEAAKSQIELKPCQSVNNHKLPLTSN